MQFFNGYHVEIKRTIMIINIRRYIRTIKKGKPRDLYQKIQETKGKFKPRLGKDII